MNINNFLWYEKYRPQNLYECILSLDNFKLFSSILSHRKIPTLLLSGPKGCGKTTVAYVLTKELDYEFMFINGSLGGSESGIEAFRTEIRSFATTISLENKGKCIIIDEADHLSNSAQDALRGLIEEVSHNCSFIFTVNNRSKLSEAIQSRCITVDFTIPLEHHINILASFIKRLIFILKQENINYDKQTLIEFCKKYFPDMRKCIGELQYFTQTYNSITSGILSKNINIDSLNIEELKLLLKNKNDKGIRNWVANVPHVEHNKIYRILYDTLYDHFIPNHIPDIIILLANYQSQNGDSEINLSAFLMHLMKMDILL